MLKVLKLSIESFLFALQSVFINKLRTILSLLGITIGIFSIISVFTIVDSLESKIRQSVASLGSDVLYVMKWPWTEENNAEYQWWKYVNRPVPNIQEYYALKERISRAKATAFVIATSGTIKYKEFSVENARVYGVSEDFDQLRNFDIAVGRYFTEFELQNGKNICVIGDKIASELFAGIDPLDRIITVEGHKTKVVGVLKREGQDAFGDSYDEAILGPVNHMRNIVNIRSESMNPMICVQAEDNVSIDELKDEVRMIMRSIRRLKPGADDTFALNQMDMLSGQLDQIFKTLNIAGWVIGIFSLLVGGFGIANIMFVSVKERTNIIGIQKALGAKRYFILLQFIFEAILLAIAGGITGLLLVFAGTLLVNANSDFGIALSLGNIMMGITISSLIGFIAGFSPAWTASRLNPVDAMNTTF
jgi:putative ABC transport system permease protein